MHESLDLPRIPGVTDLVWIGGGGFGTVYRGRQTALDRRVAVKVLPVAVDRQTSKQFDREGKLMGRLAEQSRHVLKVYDAGVLSDGRPYLLLEYCPGGSLAGHRPMPVDRVLAIAVPVATALLTAHRNDIVHRDVKPANILLHADGEPALADFGLSVCESYDGSRGLDALAPEFAAPESLQNGDYDRRSDVYGLGATLYALIESAPPFAHRPGEGSMAFMTRVIRDPVPPLRAAVPPQWWRLLTDMLAKDPRSRPEMAQVVDRLVALRGSVAGPARPPDRVDVADGAHTMIRQPPLPSPPVTDGAVTTKRPVPQRPPPPVPEAVRRRRTPLLIGVVAAIVLGGVVATVLLLRPGPPGATPLTALPGSATSPAPEVVLAEPVDRSSSVELTWQARSGLQFAVIIAGNGLPSRTELAGDRHTMSVTVDPATPYCFLIQATDSERIIDSKPRAIRGAICG
ncbi:MAG: serine/threonine-protein kinase [Actinoplanes sp.]